jgi:hypothetical protein
MALSRWHEGPLAPWAALVASFVATGLNQQFLADVLRYDCRVGSPSTGMVAGLVSSVVIAYGCWVSWTATRHAPSGRAPDETRQFIARLGMLFAVLAAVAIAWHVLATFLVPACPD